MTGVQDKKPRLFEISLLNVFLCILVIFIHVSSKPVSTADKESIQYLLVMIPWRLAAFVVYGFIFLSGFKLLLSKRDNFSYGRFLLKRLITIVIPYIIWVLVYYLYFCYIEHYFPFKISDFLGYVLRGDLVAHFYFIIIIIQFYVLAPLWIMLVKKTDVTLGIVFSLAVTVILSRNLPAIIQFFNHDFVFQYNDRVFTSYLVYWVAGCYAGKNYDKFKEILKNNRIFITIFFIVSSVVNVFFTYYSLSGKKPINNLDEFHLIYCVSAILFFMMLFINLTSGESALNKGAAGRFIKSVDRVSYSVYLSHVLIIFITDYILRNFPGNSLFTNYIIRLIAAYVITISGCLLWYKMRGAVKMLFQKGKSA